MKRFLLVAVLFTAAGGFAAEAPANPGDEVVVVYNSAVADSKKVAEHYAEVRRVPAAQVVGLKMPEREMISRTEYNDTIAGPLRKLFAERKWIEFAPEMRVLVSNGPPVKVQRPVKATVRYVVLCYGVPLRIDGNGAPVEPLPETMRPEFRKSDAAVESDLCMLPRDPQTFWLTGIAQNPFLGQTNASIYHPTNALLMVTRLDGPTFEIANALVDKAVAAEKHGLWGRAYFDMRGITNPAYAIGDAWMQGAATQARRVGFETIVDTNEANFPETFPMSHVGIYMGWHSSMVNGPFTLPKVEFMPGAFAYHLYSYSAPSLRDLKMWTPLLLDRGATCTFGYVDEPYLQATINMAAFFGLWIRGFTFGEAAYGSMNSLSWFTTAIGDPLYRPFGKSSEVLHTVLFATKHPMLEWSVLRAINQNMLEGDPKARFISILEREPIARQSAVLQEKLADLYSADNKLLDATDTYLAAHRLSTSPAQRQRITFELLRPLGVLGREAKAVELLEAILKDNPAYADKIGLYQKLEALLRKLGKTKEAAAYQDEINRLHPPPPPPPPAAAPKP